MNLRVCGLSSKHMLALPEFLWLKTIKNTQISAEISQELKLLFLAPNHSYAIERGSSNPKSELYIALFCQVLLLLYLIIFKLQICQKIIRVQSWILPFKKNSQFFFQIKLISLYSKKICIFQCCKVTSSLKTPAILWQDGLL